MLNFYNSFSIDEMEKDIQKVQYNKHIKVKTHKVEIFNMHDKADVDAYENRMKDLIVGIQAGTHKIWANDRQLLSVGDKQLWHRYLEWTEFDLVSTPVDPIKG